ncbi:MAG: hypothetical protein ACLFQR_04715, partial [Desulfovibrionales bacterium]
MKKFLLSIVLVLTWAAVAGAQSTKLFVQNTTPRSEIARNVADAFLKIVTPMEEFQIVQDKFEPAVQVLLSGTHAYEDIHVLSVQVTVFNGSCSCYYNGYIVPTNSRQITNEATNISLYLN